MPKTRHAIIAVIAILAILIGLLIAVRVFAPDENEFEPLPAAAIFSTVLPGTVYAVTTAAEDDESARNALIEKIEAEGAVYAEVEEAPAPITEEPVVPDPVDPYVYATSTVETESIVNETEIYDEMTASSTPTEESEVEGE